MFHLFLCVVWPFPTYPVKEECFNHIIYTEINDGLHVKCAQLGIHCLASAYGFLHSLFSNCATSSWSQNLQADHCPILLHSSPSPSSYEVEVDCTPDGTLLSFSGKEGLLPHSCSILSLRLVLFCHKMKIVVDKQASVVCTAQTPASSLTLRPHSLS